MKQLIPFMLSVFLLFGCDKWRPAEYSDPANVLPSTLWELEEHLAIPADPLEPDCRLPKYMAYNKNLTGFFSYEHPCDSSQVDTLNFKWRYDSVRYRVYYEFTSGPYAGMTAESKVIIVDYDMARLATRTEFFAYYGETKYIVDGNFLPVKQ